MNNFNKLFWSWRRRKMLRGNLITTSIEITFPESIVYTINRWHLRRGLIGGSLSAAWFSIIKGGVTYGVDFSHAGSGANCVTGNASLAGATRINVALSSGDQTAIQVATAVVTALQNAGVTGVTRADAVVTITNSTNGPTAPAMSVDHESTRGMWGSQRTDFGAADLGSTTDVGATPSYHLVGPNAEHRIRGVYMLNTGGASDCRLGIASGPTYSETPAAFSGGVEGIATIGIGGVRLLILSEPVYESELADKWITFRAAAGGAVTVAFRAHGGSPVGRGDLPLNGPLLSSTVSADPTVEIYTAGAYTHSLPLEGSPFNVYSAVGYIYETPDENGDYYGRGNVDTRHGYHGTADGGTPTQATAATLRVITETFRFNIPWACTITERRFALQASGGGDSGSGAWYDFTGLLTSTAPVVGAAELLYSEGDLQVTDGAGYKTHTLATPLAVTSGSIIGEAYAWGPANAATIATQYDASGSAGAFLGGWVDDGRTWCDEADSGAGARGIQAQYVTLATGFMPIGSGSATVWPSVFATGSSDILPQNHFRRASRLTRTGMSIVII